MEEEDRWIGTDRSLSGAISGLDADALSTALRMMGPEAGLEGATEHGIAASFLLVEVEGSLTVRPMPELRRRFDFAG